MEIVDIETYLSSYILFGGIFTLATVSFRYYRERDAIFWDASTYFVLLMCLYVAVPAFVHVESGYTAVGATEETIRFSAKYSLYFIFVLAMYYLFKALSSQVKRNTSSKAINKGITLVPISNNIIYAQYALIITYVLAVFFLNYPGIALMWSDRILASSFRESLNDTYKTQLMFAITISMIIYLTIKNGRKRYLVMCLPFCGMDLLTTDRGFLYQTLMASLGILLLTKTQIPVFKLIIASILIVSMEVLRNLTEETFAFDAFVIVPGELLYSAEAGYLVIESQTAINFLHLLSFSLGKVFTPQVITPLFGGIPNFREILNVESQLSFGLGGSLLSEVFSFKSTFLYICYPFIAILYLEVINALRSRFGLGGIYVFIFYLISTIAIFRGGIIFNSMEPIYYALYATASYWIVRIAFADRINPCCGSPAISAC